MKSPALAVVIAMLLSAVLAIPSSAQDNAQSQPSTQSSASSSDPSQLAPGPSPVDSASATAPTAGAPKETHNKDKNDIDDIGNRNVGKRGLGDWYSLDTDIKIGKQYAMMVEQNA